MCLSPNESKVERVLQCEVHVHFEGHHIAIVGVQVKLRFFFCMYKNCMLVHKSM